MAVFLENICTFDKCGKLFPTLTHLIVHIEDTHINYDALMPDYCAEGTYLPLSYILKYQTTTENDNAVAVIKEETAQMQKQTSLVQNHQTKPHQFCFPESDFCESESSSDSLTIEEIIPDKSNKRRSSSSASSSDSKDKPFACSIPGCNKRYKNINGVKYHLKNGHKEGAKPMKQFRCICSKSFKSLHKLNLHTQHCIERHVVQKELKTIRLETYNEMGYYPENNNAFYFTTKKPANNAGENNNNNNNNNNVVVQSNDETAAQFYEIPQTFRGMDPTFAPYIAPKNLLF